MGTYFYYEIGTYLYYKLGRFLLQNEYFLQNGLQYMRHSVY